MMTIRSSRPSVLWVSIVCVVLVVSQSFAQQQAAPKKPAPANTVDSLTAPIALYPDALIAQILVASTNVKALQSFSEWMQANSGQKGSELQGAAEQAGFDACYVALVPFPQVVQMMIQKPDWTTQLGQAFTNDKSAVFGSIQRLRAQAQAAGNLKHDSTAASREPDNIERSAGDRNPAFESAGGLRTAVQPANGLRCSACASAIGCRRRSCRGSGLHCGNHHWR
jgi:hypothetical protein